MGYRKYGWIRKYFKTFQIIKTVFTQAMYQVKFKYSIIKDIQTFFEISKEKKWLREHDIKVFKPSFLRFLKIIFARPKIKFESDIPVTCYFVSNGSWGSYESPDKIIIMPFDLPDYMSLHELIEHEIEHLKHPEADEMDHEDKEQYIENKTKK